MTDEYTVAFLELPRARKRTFSHPEVLHSLTRAIRLSALISAMLKKKRATTVEHPSSPPQKMRNIISKSLVDEVAFNINEASERMPHRTTNSDPAECPPFLRLLPAEIRNQIYELVLQLQKCNNPSCFDFICTRWHQNNPSAPPITRVCRQIRQEALPMFYNVNTIRIDISLLRPWLEHMQQAKLSIPNDVRILLPRKHLTRLDCQVTSLIKLLGASGPVHSSQGSSAHESRWPSSQPPSSQPNLFTVPLQLIEMSRSQMSPNNKWSIGAGSTDFTRNPEFWKLVGNPVWKRFMGMEDGSPPFIKSVSIIVNREPQLYTLRYDPKHIIIRECGSARLACSKVIAKVGQPGTSLPFFMLYKDICTIGLG
jgi:hypothetical protein